MVQKVREAYSAPSPFLAYGLLEFPLLFYEVMPTGIVDEDEEQKQSDDYFCHSNRVEPFVKSDLNIMLDTDAYQVIV